MTTRLTLLTLAVLAFAAAADCTNYTKIGKGICAQACLGSKIGICPTGIIIKAAGFQAGTCADKGFNKLNGTKTVKAGPCGNLKFDVYTMDSNVNALSLFSLPSFDDLFNASAMKTDLAFAAATETECPKVQPMNGVNLTEWIRASWYVQQQQPTKYQPKENLNCVIATYNQEGKTVPFFSGNVLAVHNYANLDMVNGESSNPDNKTVLCARQPDSTDVAKLLVAPCFLPNKLAGDYWILAAGPSADNYQWAVVTGGQPTVKYSDGCTTKQDSINNAGLWIFSRQTTAATEDITKAREILKMNGYTLSQLVDIPQEGCQYKGAFIKK